MPYSITLKPGLVDVALPGGTIGQGGQTYTLTDDQYLALSPTASAALFSSVTQTGGGGVSSVNSKTGAVTLSATDVGAYSTSSADSKFKVRTYRTIAQHVADTPFYVAHRGSGGEYPEHTMIAYESAVAGGAQAIEVSCHLSADGVLFCMHDTTLDRITNNTWTGSNATWTWSALNQAAQVQMQGLLGSGWANQPIPRLKDVLNRFVGKVVIFLEAKSAAAIVPLQNLLTSAEFAGCQDSVVWKQYYTSNSLPWAKSHGFYVWAYTDNNTTNAQMDAVDANVDMWGIPADTITDAQVSMVVARGKPTMVWEIHRRSEAARFTGLGVRGLMCAQYHYVTRSTAMRTVDGFASKIKSPGNIGAAKGDPTYALKYDTANSAYCPALGGNAVLMGAFCPVVPGTNGYKITFDMMFPVLPTGTLHAGLAFACADDSKHIWNSTTNTVGSYQVRIVPTTGAMRLYSVTAGVATATQIGTDLTTAAMVAGTYASFEVEVNATGIVMRRTDSTGWSSTIATTTYRGLYWHIQNGSLTDATTIPRYKNMQVVSL